MKNVINSILSSEITQCLWKELRLNVFFNGGFIRCSVEKDDDAVDYEISKEQMIEIYDFIRNDVEARNHNDNRLIISMKHDNSCKVSYDLDQDFAEELLR